MRVQSKRPDRLYTAVPNGAMRDKRLSAEARGTLAYLMSFADDWQFYMSVVADDMGMGRDKLQRVMAELKAAGYVSLEQFRGESGHLSGSTWVITDNPGTTDSLKIPLPVNPTPGESAPKKNNKQEEQKKEHSASALFDFGDQPKAKTESQLVLEALMTILPEQKARDFIAHRRALKKPMTVRAAELIAAKLARASNPVACAEKSITSGWQDVFPDDKPPEARRTQDATDRFLGLA